MYLYTDDIRIVYSCLNASLVAKGHDLLLYYFWKE